MGVPAFFRWLSRKYPSIVVKCDEGQDVQYHFDNLYLDMNGIIHPCSHPEYKAAPETEEEMFLAIFEYVERIMKIVRPKKLLYMAIDGVAPRAKMNQQRSRRFRAAQESIDKREEVARIKEELRNRGLEVKDKPKEAHFDSNVITPGTQFMINLSQALRDWVDRKLGTNDIWPKDLLIVLSDASVPGEGEHKIMDYIRKQKAQETYDPNLAHCLYGADADLIMLGLATHELNFTILREEFNPNQPKPCDICGQYGHEMKDCLGTEHEPDIDNIVMPTEPEFIFIRINVLREYLEKECVINNGPTLDMERFIDDYVFLCFFVGNDFLPHLPSLEIREGAIDRLITIYKEMMTNHADPNLYLTENGLVNLNRVQMILTELGKAEDAIFKKRQENERRFKERQKRQKIQQQRYDLPWMKPEEVKSGQRPTVFDDTRKEAYKVRVASIEDNKSAAEKLKASLMGSGTAPEEKSVDSSRDQTVQSEKRKREDDQEEVEPEDLVQLWNDGWKNRYYQHKFDCVENTNISHQVAREYIIGMCWVLRYYYQGCVDWKWFYPFHYAPFASDFVDIASIHVEFDRSAQPFRPLEQLMSVFPAASSQNLPPTWRNMMTDIQSPIIDFYPNTFKIDLNGKRAAWMGVALLPFIDEQRLFKALAKVYPDLTDEEKLRNSRGEHLIFVAKSGAEHSELAKEISSGEEEIEITIESQNFRGMAGVMKKCEKMTKEHDKVHCLIFRDPVYDENFVFPAKRLPNAISPPKVLKPDDFPKDGNFRPMIGMSYSQQRASLGAAGNRMLAHSLGQQDQRYEESRYRNTSYQQQSAPRQQSYQQSYYQQGHYQQQQQPQYRPYYGMPQSGANQRNRNQEQQNSWSFDPWQRR